MFRRTRSSCTSTAAGAKAPTAKRARSRSGKRCSRSLRLPKRRAKTPIARSRARARRLTRARGREMTAHDRARLLLRLADKIEEHGDEFAQIDTLNNGKPLRETEYDVDRRRELLPLLRGPCDKTARTNVRRSRSFANLRRSRADRRLRANHSVELSAADGGVEARAGACRRQHVHPQAVGTHAALALRLATLFEELEFPRGVVNVVTGAGPVAGAAIAESHRVDKVAFTGGTVTGRSIMRAAAGNLKKISLELGGKSPNVVFEDADFDTAVDYALFGIYANAGQVCSAGSRLILQEPLARSFSRTASRAREEDPRRRRLRSANRDGSARFAYAHGARSSVTSTSASQEGARC